ncbi:MAG: peptidoglycan D,D-transpeptidase FtsI family protein [Alphaproteobacteria bacterium]|nr:MAG: hypothetical protein B6I23_00315 [Rickettsiaceae bacterium 4572_127]
MSSPISVGKDLVSFLRNKIEGKKSYANKGRIRIITIFSLFVFLTIITKLFSISFPKTFSFSLFEGGVKITQKSLLSRADLEDRNGEILATNISIYNFGIHPNKIKNKNNFTEKILKVLPNYSRQELHKKVNSRKKFVYIKKKISEKTMKLLAKLKDKNMDFEKVDFRSYPKKEIFSHLIGFTNTDNKGLKGLEYGLNSKIIASKKSIKLSVDSRFQEVIYRVLRSGIEKHKAIGGGAILIKSDTGEILSLISFPDFDPNKLSASPLKNRFNKITTGVFEPGSVFKLFNTAIALENNIAEDKKYAVDKAIKIGGFSIDDDHKMDEKKAGLDQILIHSSNIGSVKMAWDFGINEQKKHLKKFGFLDKIKTDLGDTAHPILPYKWTKIESATISFGHGISVSPLQTILATNALINGGYYLPPTFVPNDKKSFKAKQIISEETSAKMRKLMHRIVEEGTGQKVKIEGLKIGGKTGTSEKIVNGKYDKNRLANWFVSAFPIENPEYTLLVMIDEPKGLKENFNLKSSAWNAVPITKEIIENILPFLDIRKEKNED